MAERSADKVDVEKAKARVMALAAGIDHDVRRDFARRKWIYLGGALAAGAALAWLTSSPDPRRGNRGRRGDRGRRGRRGRAGRSER